MIDKKALSTMADIMDGIVQSEEWAELQMNDPGIKAAESRLHRAMEKAKAFSEESFEGTSIHSS